MESWNAIWPLRASSQNVSCVSPLLLMLGYTEITSGYCFRNNPLDILLLFNESEDLGEITNATYRFYQHVY